MEKNRNLKFVFFGTPEVASETLEILKEHDYLPSLIVTAPDKPKGRKMVITPPPVKVWALNQSKLGSGQALENIPILQPEKLDDKFFFQLSTFNFQLFIVVAYGKIMPEKLINLPKMGSINIHYSLLPKYRGASPVESAILLGETETGVSIQKMEYKMDSGPILASEKTIINPDEKAPELRERLIKIGGELLVKILPDFIEGKIKLIPQDETRATFCKKIKKEDGLIDLNDNPIKNYNKFRAYTTWPRTYFLKEGKRIIITDAKLENGVFEILKVIPENGKEIKYNFISSN